jgi:hypothetical protein
VGNGRDLGFLEINLKPEKLILKRDLPPVVLKRKEKRG